MMRSHIRTFGRLTFEFGGHGTRIKNGASARRWTDFYPLIGMLATGMYGIPKFPGQLSWYARAGNRVELGRQDGLKAAQSENAPLP